tara:strand:+ start:1887 stop:2753 length:867 start_codon:yes stop_codon:yes gene_type:complete
MIRDLPPFFDHKIRISYSNIELCDYVDQIKHPSAREVFKYFKITQGIELSHIGDLPAKSGVGSSSAFTVALTNGIAHMNNINLSQHDVAKIAIDIEQNLIKENVGVQDQYASAIGGLILINANKSSTSFKRLRVSEAYKEYIESNLIIGFSGRSRLSSLKANKIVKTITSNEKYNLLLELQELSQQGINAFTKNQDVEYHAKLTKRIRDIKLQLNGDIDDLFITDLIESTESQGSMCTRFLGAGGGGFFVCWAPRELHQKIKESVAIKTWLDVKFSFDGCSVFSRESK